jgi:hypothetical protein
MDAPTNPIKGQSHVFHSKNTFCEHYGNNPVFGRFAFHVSKLPRKKGKMDISGGQINVQK